MTDMQHLSVDELVDLVDAVDPVYPVDPVDVVEGAASDARGDNVPHLASCDRCRDQLAALRAARTLAAEKEVVEVPEPSPAFWDHFSARVREAVANEAPPPDG